MARSDIAARPLAGCHGFSVAAQGTSIGSVETPVFPERGIDPVYLLIRTSAEIPGTFRVLPAALIERIDSEAQTIVLSIDTAGVAALPERLPRERGGGDR